MRVVRERCSNRKRGADVILPSFNTLTCTHSFTFAHVVSMHKREAALRVGGGRQHGEEVPTHTWYALPLVDRPLSPRVDYDDNLYTPYAYAKRVRPNECSCTVLTVIACRPHEPILHPPELISSAQSRV